MRLWRLAGRCAIRMFSAVVMNELLCLGLITEKAIASHRKREFR
jgi:hypothetical protein